MSAPASTPSLGLAHFVRNHSFPTGHNAVDWGVVAASSTPLGERLRADLIEARALDAVAVLADDNQWAIKIAAAVTAIKGQPLFKKWTQCRADIMRPRARAKKTAAGATNGTGMSTSGTIPGLQAAGSECATAS
jgi:hypothetical protein